MIGTFQVKHPLPSRRSAEALREQIIEYFVETKPAVGAPFLSDHQLARVAGLSRPTVRRALDDLRREGWIERRHGIGTYVGPRAGLPFDARRVVAASVNGNAHHAGGGGRRSIVRMALLVHDLGNFSRDWYSPSVLAGLDDAAHEQGVSIELLGDRDCDVRSVSARLMASRPDVFVCTAPAARHAMLIGEAQRLDIPVIGTGSYLTDLGIPTVCEDGVGAAAAAVKHLASLGHERIGFLQMSLSIPLVFQRHQGYLQGLRESGMEEDESLVLWLKWGKETHAEQLERVRSYFRRCRPTAVVCGTCWPLEFVGELVRGGEVRVPGDLSVINFDQHPRCAEWLGGLRPSVLGLPLREMGRKLAEMARGAAERRPLAKVTYLPCELSVGETVQRLGGAGGSSGRGVNESGKGGVS